MRAPKTRDDIWPFAALYTFNVEISVAYWLRKIQFNSTEILVVMFSCPSGLFAIPHLRNRKGLSRELMNVINNEIDMKEKEKGMKIPNKAEYWSKDC